MSTTASSYPSQLYHQSLYSPRDSDHSASPRAPQPPLPTHHHHHPRPADLQSQPQPHSASPHHSHPSFLRKDYYSGKSASIPHTRPNTSPTSEDDLASMSMTDSAVHQQSKRLAGLSITNSSGNKVSILNDSPHDLNKATIHNESREREYESRPPIAHPEHGLPPLRSPRSPHFRDRHNGRDYFTDDRRDPYYSPSSHRQRSESHEAGRSTSLTNAATPFRSGFDSRAAEAANSQRSRSLSSGAQLYPYNPNGPGMSPSSPFIPTGASPLPFFMRAFSEDTASDEHEAAYRGLIGHPGLPEGLLTGPSFSKRKYSCTHPGCNKRFTTSGHLARHNRIHTGERNFSCLMPGCPSKFSRQDNMMQHYRTHISPKSRRGTSKKQDNQDADNANDVADDSEAGEHQPSASQEHSPAAPAAASIPPPPSSSSTAGPSSRHDSRQSSIPRFYPADQHADEAMDHDEQMESRPSSRQQQQHLSPPSHGGPHAAYPRDHHHHGHHHHHSHHHGHQGQQQHPESSSRTASGSSSSGSHWSVPASPTSPMTGVVERMEDVTPSPSSNREQQLYYYRQQQQYQQQYQQRQLQKQQQQQAASHASAYYHAAAQAHSSHGHHHHHQHHQGHHGSISSSSSKHMASPSSSLSSTADLHPHTHSYPHSHLAHSSSSSSLGGSRGLGSSGHRNTMTPPSPQSTPATPTKYRFDPIQDCLQQERRQREEATL